jgi:hypothetical protein
MKNISFVFLLIFSAPIFAQHQSIGLRLGNPVGLTYKKYLSNSTHAFELGIGSASSNWGERYYRNSFRDDEKFDNKNYLTHTIENPLYLQARYLKQRAVAVDGLNGTFEWYWGIGALLKVARVDYRFQDGFLLQRDIVTDVDLGPEVPIGLEHTFEDVPITLFCETSLFVELANRPGSLQLKAAVGVRYNFFKNL